MWIKADYKKMLNLSEEMYTPTKNSTTKYLFYVIEIENFGYVKWSQEIEDRINFDFEIVSDLPEEII